MPKSARAVKLNYVECITYRGLERHFMARYPSDYANVVLGAPKLKNGTDVPDKARVWEYFHFPDFTIVFKSIARQDRKAGETTQFGIAILGSKVSVPLELEPRLADRLKHFFSFHKEYFIRKEFSGKITKVETAITIERVAAAVKDFMNYDKPKPMIRSYIEQALGKIGFALASPIKMLGDAVAPSFVEKQAPQSVRKLAHQSQKHSQRFFKTQEWLESYFIGTGTAIVAGAVIGYTSFKTKPKPDSSPVLEQTQAVHTLTTEELNLFNQRLDNRKEATKSFVASTNQRQPGIRDI